MQPWLQTASGRRFDLCDPRPDMVDFEVDIPEALARVPRFTGHVRAGPYSVAQHSVIGAWAILRETGETAAALAFLLHDAHEAYIGDIATPIGWAIGEMAAREFNTSTGHDHAFITRAALKALKRAIDRAIHDAAGVRWPRSDDVGRVVAGYDLRMLATERDLLLGPSPEPWQSEIERAARIDCGGRIAVWPWSTAASAWRGWIADGFLGFPDALGRIESARIHGERTEPAHV